MGNFFTAHQFTEILIGAVIGAAIQPLIQKFFRVNIYTYIKKLALYFSHAIRRIIFGKKVIVYVDCDDKSATIKSIEAKLRPLLGPQKLWVKTIENPEHLLAEPLSQNITHAIVMMITNVTPLSLVNNKKEQIQNSINSFCQCGGVVILGHDAIYRRSSNGTFEKLAGGKLDRYHIASTNTYKRVDSGFKATQETDLIQKLPGSASISDGEYLLGTWDNSVKFIYVLEGTPDPRTGEPIPLLTRKTNGEGVAYWINSGDTDESGPPKSLAVPENDLIKILTTLIIHEKK